MADLHHHLVTQAVVLAAGNGDRFRNGSNHSKLLTAVAGTPLLVRTLTSARRAGITDVHLVLGYDAESVRATAESGAPSGLRLHFHHNGDWLAENGVSVLAARNGVGGRPFALMMADHIFEPEMLRTLLAQPSEDDEVLLCIDPDISDPASVDEATKVRLEGDRIVAIGKTLTEFDALDTGVFLCHRTLFDALEASCADGNSTLTGGVARLAARGRVRGVDIGAARWCDVDTVDDLRLAEQLVRLRGSPLQRPSRFGDERPQIERDANPVDVGANRREHQERRQQPA
jgi:1L-myo-inositol 1-phosphate cytidylyltransferase